MPEINETHAINESPSTLPPFRDQLPGESEEAYLAEMEKYEKSEARHPVADSPAPADSALKEKVNADAADTQQKVEEAKIDDAVVTHDPAKAIEQAKESAENASKAPTGEDLADKTNVEGVGQSEILPSRERHPFVV